MQAETRSDLQPEKESTAQRLARSRELILRIWESRLRDQLPSASGVNRANLRDSLGEILQSLEHALETGLDKNLSELIRLAHRHGSERAASSTFSIEEALTEYNILRKVIFDVLEEYGPLSPRDRDLIYEVICFGQVKAGSEYAKIQMDREKAARFDAAMMASHLQLITDAQPTLVSYVDRNYIYQFANQTYAEWFGRDRSQVVGSTMSEVIGEEAFRAVKPKLDQALAGGPSLFEAEVPYAKGQRFIKATYIPDLHADGSIPGVFVSVSDITEIKRAQAQAELEKSQFETLMRQLPAAVVVAEAPTGKVLFGNEQVKAVWGHDVILSKDFEHYGEWKAWHLDGRPLGSHEWPLARAIQKGEIVEAEVIKIQWPNGEERFLRLNSAPVKDREGKIVAGVVVSVDITEIKAAEQVLRESEEKFRAFAEAMPQMAFIADAGGNIIYYNQRHYEYFGVKPGETESWAWKDKEIHHPDDLARTVEAWSRSLASGELYQIEYRLKRHDGVYRWHLGRAVPLRDESGQIFRWVGTNTDIHDQKEASEEHKKLIERLQSERALREQFVNTLTHDLRTPLSAINMATQMIQSRPRDPQMLHELCERVLSNVRRSDRMIQDLLDANRIKAGEGMSIDIQNMDLKDVIQETLINLESIVGKRFILQANGGFTGYWCATAIERLIENLTSNAIKYGSKETPVLIQLTDMSNQVRISVHNEGNPMAPEEVESLFNPFRRAKSADASATKGWGIGLTIVRGITEAHCGSISVESSKEEGTTFSVTLPRDSRPCREDKFNDDIRRPVI